MTIQPGFRRALSVFILAGTVAFFYQPTQASSPERQHLSVQRNPHAGISPAANEVAGAARDTPASQYAAGQESWWYRTGPGGLAAAGERLTLSSFAGNDVMAAGGRVFLNSLTIRERIFLLAGDATVSKISADRLFAAGASLALNDTDARQIVAAGGKVSLNGVRVDGDIVATGADVVLDSLSAVTGNAWITGEDLNLSGAVAGDLMVSANRLRMNGRTGGEARLSAERLTMGPGTVVSSRLVADGGILNITAVTTQDLVLSGQVVSLESVSVRDDALLAGKRVLIDAHTQVDGDAVVIADQIEIAGKILGDVNLTGREILFDGQATGNVELKGDRVEIGPSARIKGGVLHQAQTIEIAPGAEISGPVAALAVRQPVTRGSILLTLAGLGALAIVLLLPAGIVVSLILAGTMPRLMAGADETPGGRIIRAFVSRRRSGHTPVAAPGNWPHAA